MPEVTRSSRMVYEGKVVSLRIDTVELPNGTQSQREIVEHAPAIVVVPVDAAGRIHLVRQFRKPVEDRLLELPAGSVDPGEEPETAARRELAEEIGMAAAVWTGLGGFFSAPGFCSEYLHLFLAEGLTEHRLKGDDDEDIEVVPVPAEEVRRLIETNEIRDAKSVAGILRYLIAGQAGTSPR